MSVSRRSFVAILAGAAFAPSANGQTGPEMIVYKDPNCGCCRAWVMQARHRWCRHPRAMPAGRWRLLAVLCLLACVLLLWAELAVGIFW